MHSVKDVLRSFFCGKKGQTLTEYALILILIAVVVFLMLTGLGTSLNNNYSLVNSVMPR